MDPFYPQVATGTQHPNTAHTQVGRMMLPFRVALPIRLLVLICSMYVPMYPRTHVSMYPRTVVVFIVSKISCKRLDMGRYCNNTFLQPDNISNKIGDCIFMAGLWSLFALLSVSYM